MRHFLRVLSALVLLLLLAQFARAINATPEWTALYAGPANGDDWPSVVDMDAQGFIYVTGFSFGGVPGYEDDYVTIKYSADGDTLWEQRYNGSGNWVDWATALAVNEQGDVFVTGRSVGDGTAYDYATLKYAPNGSLIWTQRYNGFGTGDDMAYALCLDQNSNVIVTGSSHGGWSANDILTIKYNSAGALLWSQRFNGLGNALDEGKCAKADVNGNIYIGGTCTGAGGDKDYVVLKYNATGVLQWAAYYDGPGHDDDLAAAMDIDAANNVYIAGSSIGVDGNYDMAVVKLNASGAPLWEQRYNGPGNDVDATKDLVVGPDQNVYITGYSLGLTSDYDVVTIKYARTGSQDWVQRYDGPGGHNDRGYALALDAESNVYVAGYSNGIGTSTDYLTIRYNHDGRLEWVTNYNGLGNEGDLAMDVFVDANQTVCVTGYAYESIPSGFDFATIKYIQVPSLATIILSPYGTPIQIPANGGSFNFDLQITNNQPTVQSFQVWSMITLPGGSQYGPVLGPTNLTLAGGAQIERNRSQFIGPLFPPGNYLYYSYVGFYPDSIWDSDSFPFAKLANGDGPLGEELSAPTAPTLPTSFRLMGAYPNPFNSSTSIRYDLPEDCHVNLAIFDLQGKGVRNLVNGWNNAGAHEVNFNPEGLAAGVYIYAMTAGDYEASGKLMYLK